MVDLAALRRSIEATPPGGARWIEISRTWLEQVEIEITAGAEARAELAAIRAQGAPQEA
jgi:hypothetical protein